MRGNCNRRTNRETERQTDKLEPITHPFHGLPYAEGWFCVQKAGFAFSRLVLHLVGRFWLQLAGRFCLQQAGFVCSRIVLYIMGQFSLYMWQPAEQLILHVVVSFVLQSACYISSTVRTVAQLKVRILKLKATVKSKVCHNKRQKCKTGGGIPNI